MGNGVSGHKHYYPARDLADILVSADTTSEFREFLRDLDQDEDEDVTTRTDWLDFVLACRELHQAITGKEFTAHAQSLLITMGDKFFKPASAHRVALPNPTLRKYCADLCEGQRHYGHTPHVDAKALDVLWEAHDDVVEKLDELHQPFLVQRHHARNTLSRVIAEVISGLF